MELTYHGGNCVRVNMKQATVVVDDTVKQLGGKPVAKDGDIVLQTHKQSAPEKDVKMVIDSPGEFEVSEVSIIGVAAQAHMGEKGTRTATMYKIIHDDIRIAFLGHVFEEVTDDEIEELGHVDVLIVPVGGNGYTLDGEGAAKVIRRIDPKIVIPTHYADTSLNYEVPQNELADSLKGLGMEPAETVPKLKLKYSDITTTENLKLIVLEKQ